jgi:hypothetical protein
MWSSAEVTGRGVVSRKLRGPGSIMLRVWQLVQVRPSLIGIEGLLAIFGFTIVLVGIGVGLGLGLEAAGVGWPATLAVIPVAFGLAVGGPRLMGFLRRLMRSRPLAGDR